MNWYLTRKMQTMVNYRKYVISIPKTELGYASDDAQLSIDDVHVRRTEFRSAVIHRRALAYFPYQTIIDPSCNETIDCEIVVAVKIKHSYRRY